jgi:hypothetical protein
MDIMNAEVNEEDVETSKKVKKSKKQNNKNTNEKSTKPKIKNKSNMKVDEPNGINQPMVIKMLTPLTNPPEEKLESIKNLEEIRNSLAQCIILNSPVPLKSPSPRKTKKSITPYSKLRKRSPSRSSRRLSPLKEKNHSPRGYSPLKSRYPYRSRSPRRSHRSLLRDISLTRRRLSPLRRRSRSPLKIKSRSSIIRTDVRRRSPIPVKKEIRSRPVSHNVRRKDNKILGNEYLKRKEKIKPADKQIDSRSINPGHDDINNLLIVQGL